MEFSDWVQVKEKHYSLLSILISYRKACLIKDSRRYKNFGTEFNRITIKLSPLKYYKLRQIKLNTFKNRKNLWFIHYKHLQTIQ